MTLGAFLVGCQSTGGPYNVRNFGAIGDGQAVDTPAINRAIDAASGAGGGTVQIPAGTYLCYSIHLKSNITLYLDQGATILAGGTPDEGSYDPAEPNPYDHFQDFGHTHWHNSLIWGEDVHDVAIEGPGLIWGKGLSRGSPSSRPATTMPTYVPPQPTTAPGFSGPRPIYEGNPDNQDDRAWPTSTPPGSTEPQYPSTRDTLEQGVGNKVISLKNSHNVILRDFSILHGGHFGILVTAVDNLTIDNLKIDTNRDGMDIDCCKNVRITDCTVNSPWDDAIVLKSSYGLGTTRPCQNVTISGCAVSGGYVEGSVIDGTFQRFDKWYTGSNLGTTPPPVAVRGATSRPWGAPGRTGRIKFGTESNGGFINIAITNCTFDDCQGLAIESVDGALIEDVSISNLTMRDIVSVPIFIRLGDRARGPDQPPVGDIKRVNISNVVCEDLASKFACIISGIPGHPIEDLSISNVRIQYPGGGVADSANIQPPEREKGYPEPTMFFGMPSWGFFIRHVDGLEMNNLNLQCTTDDQRPVFQMEDVQHANLHDVDAVPAAGSSNFVLKNVTDFRATRVKGMADAMRDHVDEDRF